jgi:hypothetical protein
VPGTGTIGVPPTPIALVAIQSVPFPNAFLRMDGSAVTQFNGHGSGTVNCQFYDYQQGDQPIAIVESYEVFELILLPAGFGGFGLRSVRFSSAFLRIDGSGLTQLEGSGGGTVNCQYYGSGVYPVGDGSNTEVLIVGQQTIGGVVYYSIQSNAYQNAFLRMDGSQVNWLSPNGSGTVNCQFYPSGSGPTSTQAYELFNIIPLTSYAGPW